MVRGTSLKACKEEGKDQEYIQSNTTPDPGHIWESDKKTRKHHIQENKEVSPFTPVDHKAARNRQDSMTRNTNNKKDPQKNRRLGKASKKITGGLIIFQVLFPHCQSPRLSPTQEEGKDRETYNQIPHPTLDTIWESDKRTRKHHIQENKEASPFTAANHKAARNRQDSILKRNTNNKKDPQKNHGLGKVSKKITRGL